MLTEYLFVDQKRLDAYASQINPAGTVIEKTREWDAGLSLAGPSVLAKQTERVRGLSQHEKVEVIRDYLVQGASLRLQRPDKAEGPVFVLEKCLAMKVIVPRRTTERAGTPGFVFWLSRGSEHGKGMLCLLEDPDPNDDRSREWAGSAHSLLQSLVDSTWQRIAETVLGARITSEHIPAEWILRFIGDPVSLVKSWGCLVSKERKIETLYRIRHYGLQWWDTCSSGIADSVFGYPIWITADS